MGKPEQREKAPVRTSAKLETVSLAPQQRAVDQIIQKIGAPNVDPKHRAELARLLSTVDLKNPDAKPEENPRALGIASEQLKKWGYKVNDIDRGSLALENDADKKAADVHELVRKGALPTLAYKSNVGIYGFESRVVGDRMEYKKSAMDKIIDLFENLLRTADDTGGNIFAALFKKGMRKKADENGIEKNIRELGLSSHFDLVRAGGAVTVREKTEDYKKGALLDDLLRKGASDSYLKNFDGVAAIKAATQMVADVHAKSNRGIGELLGNDIVLQVKDGQIKGARLTLPDMDYESHVAVDEQKAMDLLDFCFSVGSAGMQRGGEPEAKKFIEAVLKTYPHANVKAVMKKLLADGKPHATMHNKTRLGFDRVQKKDDAFKKVKVVVEQLL